MSSHQVDDKFDDATSSQLDEETEELGDPPSEPSKRTTLEAPMPPEATTDGPTTNTPAHGGDEASQTSAESPPRPVESMRRGSTETPSLVSLTSARAGQATLLDSPKTTLGRNRAKADVWFTDSTVSRLHAVIERLDDGDYQVRDLDSSNGTYVNRQRVETTRQLEAGDKIVLSQNAILKFATPDSVERDFHERMYESSVRDRLTGANTREYLEEQMVSEMGLSKRYGDDVEAALLMLDIDNFKEVNDTYGHPVGDTVLAEFSELCQAEIRAEDVFARYGGEEFAVLLRMAKTDRITDVSERLRHAVASNRFAGDDLAICKTVSIGCAKYSPEHTSGIGDWIGKADRALYDAKEAGRNRVRMYDPSDSNAESDVETDPPA